MRRHTPAVVLTALGIAATAMLTLATPATSAAGTYVTPADCIAGGGHVLTLPPPHHNECVGGTDAGDWIYPPAP